MAKKIFVIPHFHYDLAWIRTERTYLSVTYRILEKMLQLMDKYKDFKYLLDQTYYLEKLKSERPELFRRIVEKVAEERIEIVNGGYTMPDLNLVSPSTLRKAFALANQFAEREFNVKPQVAWLIDCFGHQGLMPRIARDSGLKYYVFWRGMKVPSSTQDFIWEGSDRTRIITHWLKHGYSLYGWGRDLGQAVKKCKPTFDYVFIPFGRDFYIPDERLIKKVYKTEGAKFATPSEFFREIEKCESKLPVVAGEHLSDYANFKGVYSSRISYKQIYRQVEDGLQNSKEATEEDWKTLCCSAFHDTICGTGIDKIYPEPIKKLQALRHKLPGKETVEDFHEVSFPKNISFQLKLEAGDLYHSRPFGGVRARKVLEGCKSYLHKDGMLELLVNVDFKYPHKKLEMVIKTGIKNGNLLHSLEDSQIKREPGNVYALTGYFEYWDCDMKKGLRVRSNKCFDYEIRDNGDIYMTLVRSVLFLSHGDAGPIVPCKKALELGKHSFEIRLQPLGNYSLL